MQRGAIWQITVAVVTSIIMCFWEFAALIAVMRLNCMTVDDVGGDIYTGAILADIARKNSSC